MKLIKRISSIAIFSSALLFTHAASAYLQLSYTSDLLPFKQGYLGGEPDDSVGTNEPPYPSFSVAFANTNGDSGAQSLSGSAQVNIFDWPYLFETAPVSVGSITLDDNGTPTAWNFSLEITKSSPGYSIGEDTPPDEYQFPSRTSWSIESSHGANTCNCDWLKWENDLYIERAYYSWAYANTVGALWGETNSADNWKINKVDVPEPQSYLLFLLGLVAIGITRVRGREFFCKRVS